MEATDNIFLILVISHSEMIMLLPTLMFSIPPSNSPSTQHIKLHQRKPDRYALQVFPHHHTIDSICLFIPGENPLLLAGDRIDQMWGTGSASKKLLTLDPTIVLLQSLYLVFAFHIISTIDWALPKALWLSQCMFKYYLSLLKQNTLAYISFPHQGCWIFLSYGTKFAKIELQ